MKWILTFVSLITILFITSCNKKTTENFTERIESIIDEQRRYQVMAEQICDCTRELISIYKKIEDIPQDEKASMGNQIQIGIDGEAIKADECIKKVKEKQGEFEVNQEMSDAALRQFCPDFYSMLKIGKMK